MCPLCAVVVLLLALAAPLLAGRAGREGMRQRFLPEGRYTLAQALGSYDVAAYGFFDRSLTSPWLSARSAAALPGI